MLKFLNHKFASGFALLILMIIGSSFLYSQQEEVIGFQAYPNYKLDGLEMSWYLNDLDFSPVAVQLYMEKGVFNSMEEMENEELATTLYSEDWQGERGMYYYNLEKEFEKGYYTFYLKVSDSAGVVQYSNVAVVNFVDWDNLKYLEFTSIPEEKAIVGEVYSYTAIAYDKENPDADIAYSLIDAPEGMTIDEMTGELTWTPSVKGYYNIWLHAEVIDNPDAMGDQYFNVNVFACKEPAVVSGEIRDSKDNLVKEGFVQLFEINILDSANGENMNSYYSPVVDGIYSVEVDEGEYFVVFQDKFGFYEFYENAFDWEDATTVTVGCGENTTINMKLSEEMSSGYFTASGNVAFEDGTVGSYQSVYFEGVAVRNGIERMIMLSSMTDETGNYSIELPNGYTYIAYVDMYWDPVTGIQRVLYYDQTYNRDEAEKIILDANRDGINFVIDKDGGDYTYYKVSGNVSTEDNQPVMGAIVAFEGFYDVEYGKELYYYSYAETDSSGNYSIDLPDFVEYRAYVTSANTNLYRPLFYNQTYNPEEADILVLTEDLAGINFVIEDPDFNMFKVSGRVTNSDGDGIEGTFVSFDGFNEDPDYYYNRWNQTVLTNSDGYYEIELPEIFKYIASAYESFDGTRKCIQPMFFDQVYNPEQATIIELTADRNDINFQFGEGEGNFENSISGTVINDSNEMIQDVFVMAYLIGNQDDEFFFDGRASMANSDGEFIFESLNPGKYVFLAVPKELTYLPGFYKENDFATMNWEEATVVELEETSAISGLQIKLTSMQEKEMDGGIIQANGRVQAIKDQNTQERNAVSGAIVYLEDSEGKVQKYSTSNNDGSFNLKNLPMGAFKLKVEKIGYQAFSKNITFSGDSYYDLGEILLTPEVLSKKDEYNYSMLNVKVSPNPVVDNASISFDAVAGQAEIRLLNAKGQTIISTTINTVNGSNNHTLSLSEFANGAYFVVVDNGGKSFAYPIVINR